MRAGSRWGHCQLPNLTAVLGCTTACVLTGHQASCCSALLQVHAKYITLARSMQGFEKLWFNQWQEKIDQLAVQHLKQPILKEDPDTKRSVTLHLDVASCSAAQPAWLWMVSVPPMLRACRVSVNFSMQLTKLIRETRYLDRMGFNIPEIALNVTLQEEKYYSCTDGLANMLEQYYQVTAAPMAASAGASSACAAVGRLQFVQL